MHGIFLQLPGNELVTVTCVVGLGQAVAEIVGVVFPCAEEIQAIVSASITLASSCSRKLGEFSTSSYLKSGCGRARGTWRGG